LSSSANIIEAILLLMIAFSKMASLLYPTMT
jgi:hypothetical protein